MSTTNAITIVVFTVATCSAQSLIGRGGQTQYPSPVRELNGSQESLVGGASFTEIAVSSTDLRTAAYAHAVALGQSTDTKVERGLNTTSAVYAGASVPGALGEVTPTPAETSAPPADQVFDFKESGNSAQSWATMKSNGLPFLHTRVFGQASTRGAAAWTAKLVVPGGSNNMYVRFTVPPVKVTGVNEEDGPSKYQSRVRAELLLNGHPVWTSEAIRFNQFANKPVGCIYQAEQATRLQTFGTPFPGLSSMSKETASSTNPVTLALGAFPAGQTLELSLVVRADTSVSGDCCYKNDEFFCTGATAMVDWSNVGTPVRFWSGPAI
jgi:hypothetical protein